MNSDLKQFLAKYLTVVFGTLLFVGFFTFITIPYCLGGHPGEDSVANSILQAPAPAPGMTGAA